MDTVNRLRIEFTIPEAKVISELSPNSRAHWSKGRKKSSIAHGQAFYFTKEALWRFDSAIETIFTPPVKLTCSRYFAGVSKAFDEDAIGATFKPYIDGITEALGLGEYYTERKTNKRRWKGWDDPAHMKMKFTQQRTDKHYLTFVIEETGPDVTEAWEKFKEVIANDPGAK